MSGGVDSSVVAALAARTGAEVVGVTLQLYDHGMALAKKGACCAGQDIHDARNVADRIGIPHYVLDYESRFREQVMEDFADTYLSGSTPIPVSETASMMRSRSRQLPLCPECQCPTPTGELHRWQVCSICAAKRW